MEKLEICVKVKKLIDVDADGCIVFEDGTGTRRRMIVRKDNCIALVDDQGQPMNMAAVYDHDALLGFTKARE